MIQHPRSDLSLVPTKFYENMIGSPQSGYLRVHGMSNAHFSPLLATSLHRFNIILDSDHFHSVEFNLTFFRISIVPTLLSDLFHSHFPENYKIRKETFFFGSEFKLYQNVQLCLNINLNLIIPSSFIQNIENFHKSYVLTLGCICKLPELFETQFCAVNAKAIFHKHFSLSGFVFLVILCNKPLHNCKVNAWRTTPPVLFLDLPEF